MTVEKLGVIGWFFVGILVSGLCLIFAGKSLHAPLAIVHKLLAVVCLVLVLLRFAGALRLFASPPALRAAILAFVVTFLAAFVTGVVQSIPACAGPLWLNLHRAAAALAAITCAVAARFVAAAHHP